MPERRDRSPETTSAPYYGRELFFAQQHEAAITELERYLALPGATWKEERAAALRHISKCHLALGRAKEAQRAALRGVLEDGDLHRDSWLEVAVASDKLQEWRTMYWAATQALAITERQPLSFGDSKCWGWWPHDLAALAAHYAGFKQEALRHGKEAAALQPNDARLKGNLQFYLNSVQQSPSLTESAVLSALRTVRPSGGCAHCSCLPLLPLKHPASATPAARWLPTSVCPCACRSWASTAACRHWLRRCHARTL